jgi:hypothetical protein
MPQPSDQENFSIDEIIDRLKNSQNEDPLSDGELVTRADGTQAIRVRRRKRRSHQPHKDERKRRRHTRMIQVSAVLLVILVGAFTFGSAIIYANSVPFRQKILRIIGTSSGAEVKIEQFRVNPARALAGRVILKWPEGNALRELTLRTASADISPLSFLGKSLVGSEITFNQGALNLSAPQAGEPLRVLPPGTGSKQLHFDRYVIPKLQVIFGNSPQPVLMLQDSEASFEPKYASARPQLLLNRGEIVFRGWPKTRLDRAHIEFRGNEVDIVGMRLFHQGHNRGIMELEGTVFPYALDRPSVLSVRMDSYPIAGIAGAEMERLISGTLSTVPLPKSNYLSFKCGSEGDATLSLSFQNLSPRPLEIRGFPFLMNLARVMEDNWYERPVFEVEATGALLRTSSYVTLKELDLQNKDRMAVRGRLTLTSDRHLSGELRIGIAPAMVETCPDRRLHVLAGPVEDGFRWFTLKIDGSPTVPKDNFLALLEAAKTAAGKPKTATQGVPGFEELTAPE